jgi:M6 family metalloprotease-like protein
MRKALTALTLVIVLATVAHGQIVPPAPGVELPDQVLQSVHERGPGAFQFKRAWIEKARKIRETREAFVEERGFYQRDMMPMAERPEFAVSGNYAVPVFCSKYSDTGADPYPAATLQTRLFTGPHVPRTMTQFYDEISYGDLNLTGTVYGWTLLPGTNAFYAGAGTCNGLCGTAQVDEFIKSTLTLNDGAVDFSQYDNDGPDGLPDSGDDDGFVDAVAFVHPEQGAECGVNGNIWSHRFALSGWPGNVPWTTNDARTGGGFIRVDDYVIMPAFNCGGLTTIDIGVFCHEFGHAFGLPDLYDTNGGSQAVGHWCLMAAGNWNLPDNPAHMSAWSKDQLGWTDVTVVDNPPANYNVDNVEANRDIYRLDIMHERWRRMTDCKITGNYSMRCGLLAAEAVSRNWVSGSGYGNGWTETLSRDFEYNGAGSVALTYQFNYNLETDYDYVFGEVTVGSTTSQFVVYNDVGSGSANIDLTPYVGGGGATPYTVSFRMTSDVLYSDEDGNWPTPCGAFVLDEVNVNGGGEAYYTGFEDREDGWAPDMTPPNEHFFVENRQPLGSDVNVAGGGGLAIWHIDNSIASTGQFGNQGTGNRPRGVALEQADGLFNLESGANRGDAGDPYPGSTNKLAMNGATTPNSNGYGGASTVTVALLTGNGDPITATMRGGWAAPTVTTVTPNTGTSGSMVTLQIDGAGFAKVGTAELVLGATTIPSTSVEWVGKDRILVDFDLGGAANGVYDVVVFNPYDASGALLASYEVTGATAVGDDTPSQFVLRPNYPNPFNPSTNIRFEVATNSHVTLRVYDVSGALVRTLVDETKDAGSHVVEWDGRNDQGSPASSGVYFYRLTAPGFSDVRKMTLVK